MLNKKILFVTDLNELSGSCISLNELIVSLSSYAKFEILLASPHGSLFNKQNIKIYNCTKNLLYVFKNFFILYKYINNEKPDYIILNTIRCAPYSIISPSKTILYYHELFYNNALLFIIQKLFCYIAKLTFVVNPSMVPLFHNAVLLPNILPNEVLALPCAKTNSVLMIAMPLVSKGIFYFTLLAEFFPEYKFILLTDLSLADTETKALLLSKAASSNNLIINQDQNNKAQLISSAKYLISLSMLNETFGRVLMEAIKYNTIPICTRNNGYSYCLNNNSHLFIDLNNLKNDFIRIDSNLSKCYSDTLANLKQYQISHFSSEVVLNIFFKHIL
jgi:hypothetical protein